jgi:hypothetical protein
MTKAKAKVEFDDSWLTRSEKAIDASGRYARLLCLLLLCASIFSPVLMIGMKAATVNAVPENFCDEFVLDVNGTRECDVDKENTGLYLRSMSVSGRGCAGALSRYQNDAPVISVWASSAVSLNDSGVRVVGLDVRCFGLDVCIASLAAAFVLFRAGGLVLAEQPVASRPEHSVSHGGRPVVVEGAE